MKTSILAFTCLALTFVANCLDAQSQPQAQVAAPVSTQVVWQPGGQVGD